MRQIKNMYTTKDRFVTPAFKFPGLSKSMGIMIPTLDDDSDVIVEVADVNHTFNYPGLASYAAEDVVMELQCDDEDGTVLVDNVANLKMTEQGDPTYTTSAALAGLGKMIVYDGAADMHDCINDDLNSGISGAFKKGDFSVEMVVNLTDTTNSGTVLIEKRAGSDGVGFSIGADSTGEQLTATIEDADGSVTLTPETDIADGTVKHIVVTFDRDGNMTPYINSVAGTAADISAVEKTIATTGRLALFGDSDRANVVTGSCYFVRVYSKVLSADDILDNYNTLIGTGFPGWIPVIDFQDGQDLLVSGSTYDPSFLDLTQFIGAIKGHHIRARCATEQTTSATDLRFVWVWS